MNELPRQPKTRATTQAAEGVPRLRWTLDEFERLTELGVFSEDDRIELIGGELVPMSPKGNRHEVVRGALHTWLRRHLPEEFDYHVESGWRADGTEYMEPDFLVGPAGCSPTMVAPEDVVLVIEVAFSSLRFDLTAKARRYASMGVREYWVVDAKTLVTNIHREPTGVEYAKVTEVSPGETLAPLFAPTLAVKLSELPIE